MVNTTSPSIGTLAEKSLHAALKTWYARPGDQLEVRVDGFVIDIVRDSLLIEIQTCHLYAMKRKLNRLLEDHLVRVLHPIPQQKWIVRETGEGNPVGRRKSPKHGRVIDVFREIVYISDLIPHPNLSLEVLLTHEEEVLRDDGKGIWWRKRWSIHDRRLLEVVEQHTLQSPADYLALLPDNLKRPFTNRDLAAALKCHLTLAPKMTYTLRKMDLIEQTGKQGNAYLFSDSF